MGAVARRMLCELDHHGLGVAQEQSAHAGRALHLFQDDPGRDPQRAAGDLTQRFHRGGRDTEDDGNADEALVPDRRRFHVVGVRHLDDEGNHPADGEIHVANLTAGRVEHLARLERFRCGATEQAITFLRSKDGEQTIGQNVFRHRGEYTATFRMRRTASVRQRT